MHFTKVSSIMFVALAAGVFAQEDTTVLPVDNTTTIVEPVNNTTTATATPTATEAGAAFTLTTTVVDFPFTSTTGPQTVVTEVVTTTVQNDESITLTQTAAETVTTSVSIAEETTTISATNTLFEGGSSTTASLTATVTEFAPPAMATDIITVTDTEIIHGESTSTIFGAAQPTFVSTVVVAPVAPVATNPVVLEDHVESGGSKGMVVGGVTMLSAIAVSFFMV